MEGEPRTSTGGADGPADASPEVRRAIRTAQRLWWASVVRGCLALFLGVGALLSDASPRALVNFIAIYWLLGGVVTIRWALGVRWRRGSRLGLSAGVLAILTGLALLLRDALADLVSTEDLITAVALTTLATGCLRIVGAFEVEVRTGRRWTVGGILLGSVEVVLGIILLVAEASGPSAVRATLGAWGVVAGSLLLLQGLRVIRRRTADADAAAG